MTDFEITTRVKSYLRTQKDGYIYDYIIDGLGNINGSVIKKLHNVMRVPDNKHAIPRGVGAMPYYKIADKVSSVVRFNYYVDMFEERVYDWEVRHLLEFVRVNGKHIFIIVSDNFERAVDFDLPDNAIYCSVCHGDSAEEDVERLFWLGELRGNGFKTGVFYLKPTSALTWNAYDILFVHGVPYVKIDYPYSWLPEHRNMHFDEKGALAFREYGAKVIGKLPVFRCWE